MAGAPLNGSNGSAVRFVGSGADGLPLKRKQVQQACAQCRQKKKRCDHTTPSSSSARPGTPPSTQRRPPRSLSVGEEPSPKRKRRTAPHYRASADRTSINHNEDEDSCQVAATQLVELSSRFVGDLNPEGIFIEAATPHVSKKELPRGPGHNHIGIWLPPTENGGEKVIHSPEAMPGSTGRSEGGNGGGGTATQQQQQSRSPERRHHRQGSTRWSRSRPPSDLAVALERARSRYLNAECLAILPPDEDYEALKRIFLDKIHPILPVFPESDLAGSNPDPVYSVLVKQVVALTAGLDHEARPYLRLLPTGSSSPPTSRPTRPDQNGGRQLPLLAPQDFHSRLADAVFPVLEAEWVQSRIDEVRILCLMSLFFQPYDAADRDRGPRLISTAIHHIQSTGAHLEGYTPQRSDEGTAAVFCAVYAADRILACFYARPVLIYESDVEIDIEATIDLQPPCFKLFLKIIRLLERVFPMYRPRGAYFHVDVPVFESLIMDTGTGKAPTKILATLETLYHSAAVLSCRQQRECFSDTAPENDRSHLPHSNINPRRSLSADRIVWAVQNEDLCPFPFVPYAMSLSLSVQYRKMRYSKTLMFRNRARNLFREIVNELARLGGAFSSARVNAELGEMILREMEKTAAGLCRDEGANGTGTGDSAPAAQVGTPGAGQSGAGAAEGAVARASTPRNGDASNGISAGNFLANGPMAMIDAAAPASIAAAAAMTAAHVNGNGLAHHLAHESINDGGVGGVYIPSGNTPVTAAPDQQQTSVFDNLDADADLFDYFDPNFSLDTALEANLNMGFPVNWAVGDQWNNPGGTY